MMDDSPWCSPGTCQACDDARRVEKDPPTQGKIDALTKERDETKQSLDRLAKAFENAMLLMQEKVQLAYVSGWTAGRVEDDRVTLGKDSAVDATFFIQAVESHQRWEKQYAAKRAAEKKS